MDIMGSITDELERNEVKDLMIKLVEKAQFDWKSVDMQIFQFFIECFGKEYEFTNQNYDDICSATINLQQFVIDVYESNDTEDSMIEWKMEIFMDNMIKVFFEKKILNDSIVTNWVTFVANAAEHQDILVDSKMKATAHLVLVYMLVPFVKVMSQFNNPEIVVSDETKVAISRSVERIINNIPFSFQYEKYTVSCAEQYFEALSCHYDLLIMNSSYLNVYRAMLQYDSRPLLSLAIKEIVNLCQVDDLDDVMKEFLFNNKNRNEVPIEELIIKLVNFKNLRHEVIDCLKNIAKLRIKYDIPRSDSYNEIFVNIFSKSKKTVVKTEQLMKELRVNFWLEIVKLLNYCRNDDVDLEFILTSIDSPVNPELILEVVEAHINEPVVSRRAAEVFNKAFEISNTQQECLPKLIEALKIFEKKEATFILLLQTFIGVDNEILVEVLKVDINYLTQLLMPTISNLIVDFHKPSSLDTVVAALKKLYIIEPASILPRVRDITKQLYEILMKLGFNEFNEREKLIPKLSILFECKAWSIADNITLTNLYNFCQKHCINIKYTYFPQFQRFYVNLMKHFWMLLVRNKRMPIATDSFIKDTNHIHALLKTALKCSKNSIQDNSLILCSLMDLYLLFQPKMTQKSSNQFFNTFNIQLSKNDARDLIDSIEENLFPESENFSYYQQLLIQNFITFYKSYIDMPSLASWQAFLKNYTTKSFLKTEIETIMKQSITLKKSIFEQAVAFATLNFGYSGNIEQFRVFFNGFDEFMRKNFDDLRVRAIRYGMICSIVLEKFSKTFGNNVDAADDQIDNDKMAVLDCITIIIKNYTKSFKQNLLKFINIDENDLSVEEVEKLSVFKEMLMDDHCFF